MSSSFNNPSRVLGDVVRVALHQLAVSGEKRENLEKALRLLESGDAYLHVFPEYLMGVDPGGPTRDYVWRVAEPIDGEFASRIVEKTGELGVAAVFTMFLREGPGVYNAAVLAEEGKVKAVYRKIHLFDAYGYRESSVFSPGREPVVADLKGLRLGIAVCFDLRFPELFRSMFLRGAEVFVVPSAWYRGPYKVEQWKALTAARAHENTSYLVAVNQVGESFTGHSLVATPLGHLLVDLGEGERSIAVDLDKGELASARERIPVRDLLRLELYREWYAGFKRPGEASG